MRDFLPTMRGLEALGHIFTGPNASRDGVAVSPAGSATPALVEINELSEALRAQCPVMPIANDGASDAVVDGAQKALGMLADAAAWLTTIVPQLGPATAWALLQVPRNTLCFVPAQSDQGLYDLMVINSI